ncbi:ThiF family adenylyltransferase [Microbacterium deminutum]|uniref:Adenylyltransferase/sulfurtransferase MoeZ n=1 Tax=Microbacterium deminutum TaxID=344164 RepID=A0ABP5CG09_9MICO
MSLPPLVEPVDALDEDERARTARHTALAGFGELGQRRLAAAHVAVVGAGGLGSAVVLALAAAGVGTLTIIDDDDVEASNLQRQVMHRRGDVGTPKVDSAVRVAGDLSPRTVVHARKAWLSADNARELLVGADVVIDGTDTFETREAVASACEDLGVPLVWGVIQEFYAQATVFWSEPPAGIPAVRLADLYPPESVGEVPTCEQVGVLGALCLQVGAILATETIKLVTGIGDPLLGRVLVIDALRGRTDEVALRAGAPVHDPRAHAAAIAHIDLAAALAAQADGATLLDVREPHETALGVLPGARTIPLADILADPARAGAGPVVVVCKVGARALRAARALEQAGIEASVLTGGMDAWDVSSLPRTAG